MKSLSCADMGGGSCHFVAEGTTDEEVMDKMSKHAQEMHADKMAEMSAKMSKEDMTAMMKSKIKTT